MINITIEQAQAELPELIEKLGPGEEAIITRASVPLAQITRTPPAGHGCKAGCYKKSEFWMAPDFDAPLEDFRDYLVRPDTSVSGLADGVSCK